MLQEANSLGMHRLQWQVLSWNENAIRFYKRLGAVDITETEQWLTYRMDKAAIANAANSAA